MDQRRATVGVTSAVSGQMKAVVLIQKSVTHLKEAMMAREMTSGFELFELPTYNTSATELAEKMDVDYPTAQGYIKMLVKMGLAVEKESRKVEGKKGKPTKIYEIPTAIKVAA